MIYDNLKKILKKNLLSVSKSDWRHLRVAYSNFEETLKECFSIETLEEIENILKLENVSDKEWIQLKKVLLPFVSNVKKIDKAQVQELIEKDSNRYDEKDSPFDPDGCGYRTIAQKIREEQGLDDIK